MLIYLHEINPNTTPQNQNKKLRGSVAKSIAALTLSVSAATGIFGVTEAGASNNHHSQDSNALKVLTKDITILDKGGIVDVTSAEVKIQVQLIMLQVYQLYSRTVKVAHITPLIDRGINLIFIRRPQRLHLLWRL